MSFPAATHILIVSLKSKLKIKKIIIIIIIMITTKKKLIKKT